MKEAKKLLYRRATKNGRKSTALARMTMILKRDSLGSSVEQTGVPSELNTQGDEDDAERE